MATLASIPQKKSRPLPDKVHDSDVYNEHTLLKSVGQNFKPVVSTP